MNINSLEENNINQFEYCFLLENARYNDYFFKINIPKLMPLININEPKEININIGNNIFINDDKYKINNSKQIKTQNYLSINKFKNANFYDKSNDGIIEKKEKFICCFMNGNIKDVYLTDNI